MLRSAIVARVKLVPAGIVVVSALLIVSSAAAAAAPSADTIWINGPIITVDDAHPRAEAVAVNAGRILAVGAQADVMRTRGPATKIIDLRGRTLLPGFIDAHGHVSGVGLQAVAANLLPPPDGPNSSIAGLQRTLREYMRSAAFVSEHNRVIGFGYDDSQLAEHRHPTRDDLDAVSRDLPILVIHQSGHLAAANSKALGMAGIAASTPDPEGGEIRREERSREPNGVLEETAFFAALARVLPRFTQAQSIAMLERGQQLYLSYGYTTIQDGRAMAADVRTAVAAAKQGKLVADVVSYPDVLQAEIDSLMQPPWYRDSTQPPQYQSHFRIGGVKLTLDGSPQGKTAWLSKPYFKPPAGKPSTYAGYGVVKDDLAAATLTRALRNRWQILTHANGDRAIDQLIGAMRAAQAQVPNVDVRPVLIHGQTLRKDQVDQLKQPGIFPSLFPMHTFYWGDWHRLSVLGPERAENISPTGWLLQRGMMFTSHHDAPVAFPNSIRVLAATVNRTTRSGYVLGQQHRVEPIVALKAMTLWAAYQCFEEKTKGSIEVGKLADFAILSDDPLKIDRARLSEIKVLETIKEGKSIYREVRDQ